MHGCGGVVRRADPKRASQQSQAGQGPTQGPTQKQAAAKAAKFPCLRCRKNVAKNSKSVQCKICQHWVHVDCEGMPPELYNMLANPDKYGAVGLTWNCTSCLASSARVLEVVNKYENRIKEVESRVSTNEAAVGDLTRKVDAIGDEVRRRDDKLDRIKQQTKREVFEEIKQRDTRKMNAIFHGVPENDREDATGGERREWDRRECLAILSTLRMGLEDSDVKFTRRLGEATATRPRPLCVGLYSESERDKLLRRARDLDNTKYNGVSICADLTWQQREEEAELNREAARRNERDLTEDDRSKNLQWAVVGAKGQKRLVKTAARDEMRPQRGSWRGRGRGGPHQPPPQRRLSPRRDQGPRSPRRETGRASPRRYERRRSPTQHERAREEQQEQRLSRRRPRSDSEEEAGHPPGKR